MRKELPLDHITEDMAYCYMGLLNTLRVIAGYDQGIVHDIRKCSTTPPCQTYGRDPDVLGLFHGQIYTF